ncbi:MAG: TIGR04076 family protein [Promethearchaeati archaeon]
MKFIDHPLIIEVIKIEGICPVYIVGDKTIIKGSIIDMEKSDAVCIHSLFCLRLFIMALREGVISADLGLSTKKNGLRYFQRLDPGKPYTNRETVTFKILSSI